MIKTTLLPLKLGTLVIDLPIIAAPLAGVSDKAYRRVLKEAGVPLVFTEMVSAKALGYKNKRSEELIDIEGELHPIGMQLFGRNPRELGEAAKFLESKGADIIDFNVGCPAPKIVKNFEGSALLKEPRLAIEILETLVKSVTIPVTLKIRKAFSGTEHLSLPIIKGGAEVGIAGVFVHARTREEYYSGHADWDYIRRVKESVSIPVIGNGDVTTPLQAKAMLEETGCDGILIGRGFLGNPFLYGEIHHFFETGEIVQTSVEERLGAALQQLNYAILDKGEEVGVKEMRKHLGWYLKGLRNSSVYRNQLNRTSSKEEMETIIRGIASQL